MRSHQLAFVLFVMVPKRVGVAQMLGRGCPQGASGGEVAYGTQVSVGQLLTLGGGADDVAVLDLVAVVVGERHEHFGAPRF